VVIILVLWLLGVVWKHALNNHSRIDGGSVAGDPVGGLRAHQGPG